MRNRTVLKLFGLIAPLFTWLVSALLPGRKASVMATECRNKCKIMALVQNLESYMDPEGKVSVQTIVEKCYSLGTFRALWAVEGAGKDLAEWHIARTENPARILLDAPLDPKWNKALLMLHAGIGLGFAKYHVERLGSRPSNEEVERAVTRTVDLCRNNSRSGFYGAAIESLGLVSRFIRDAGFCRLVGQVLAQYAPDSAGYFWRGVGRCLYFHPANFLPGLTPPRRAITLCEAEAPTPELKQAMFAGIAWPLTIVNMTHPEVMESALENDGFSASPGFLNGVVSSIVMRYDTTPDDPLIQSFRRHRPSSPAVRALWESRVKSSVETALSSIHPALKKHNRLEEVFRYQPLTALVERLERENPA